MDDEKKWKLPLCVGARVVVLQTKCFLQLCCRFKGLKTLELRVRPKKHMNKISIYTKSAAYCIAFFFGAHTSTVCMDWRETPSVFGSISSMYFQVLAKHLNSFLLCCKELFLLLWVWLWFPEGSTDGHRRNYHWTGNQSERRCTCPRSYSQFCSNLGGAEKWLLALLYESLHKAWPCAVAIPSVHFILVEMVMNGAWLARKVFSSLIT